MKTNSSALSSFVDHAQQSPHHLSQSWNTSANEERLFDEFEQHQLSLSMSGSSLSQHQFIDDFQGDQQSHFADVLAECMRAPSSAGALEEARRLSLQLGPRITQQTSERVASSLFASQQNASAQVFGLLERLEDSQQWASDYQRHAGAPPPVHRQQRMMMRQRPYMPQPMLMQQLQHRPPPPMRRVVAPRDTFKGIEQQYEAQAEAEKELVSDEEAGEWFDGFLQKEDDLSQESFRKIASRLSMIDDEKLQNSEWMQFVRDLGDGSAKIVDNQVVRGDPRDQWQAHYEGQRAAAFDEMEQVWSEATEEHPEEHYHELRRERYAFSAAPNAKYAGHADPFQLGLELFDAGRFSDAILAFEEEVKQRPDHARAWHLLGKCHQEGDTDDQAIAALNTCIELDAQAMDALLDLSVSYTNNMRKDLALDVLQTWLRSNPKYTHLAMPGGHAAASRATGGDVDELLRELYTKQDKTIEAFIAAARLYPQDIDADVQIALGLLFNLSLDYDRAIECFKAALSVKKDDYALWNKLGATLANNSRSEDAMHAYFQALERKPLYVRARANLGISFLALKLFSEAAKQFLSALSIQPSAHIWANLETAFAFMQREDLLEKARAMDVNAFRSDFDF